MITERLKQFRTVGLIEGISFLVLIFIAMPLKYLYAMPLAVKFAGIAHGALFSLYIVLLLLAAKKYGWNGRYTLILFISSLIPFGTFYMDSKLKAQEALIKARAERE